MNKLISLVVAGAMVAMMGGAQLVGASEHHVSVRLVSVNDDGVVGRAQLEQLPHGGTQINVRASNLEPGEEYVSLYYGNHTCEIEEDSVPDDIIGHHAYTGNAGGQGQTHGRADEDLDEINSISVRYADTLELLACGDVHP